MNRYYQLTALVGISLISPSAFSLTVEEYLGQVMEKHDGAKAAQLSSEGASKRSKEGNLIFTPKFFAQADYSDDQRKTAARLFQGNQTLVRAAEAGFMKKFDFGLDATLSYRTQRTQIKGVDKSFVSFYDYYDNTPRLQLTQSLWRNWLGKESQASAEIKNQAAVAQSYEDSYRLRNIKAEAENAYWNVVQARANVEIQKGTVERAKRIRDINKRKDALRLADKVDLLQADASLEYRELNLQTAKQTLERAERYFNKLRGSEENNASDELVSFSSLEVESIPVPQKGDMRDDVRAALARSVQTKSQVELAIEQNKPNLEIYTSLTTNGRDKMFSKSYDQSFSDAYTNNLVGVRFSAPLDFGLVRDTTDGYKMQEVAAKHDYNRKKFEQDREWNDLVRRFDDTKRRLKLAKKLSSAQEVKLKYERDRLSKGLTTTFQVLNFEQDFNDSQLEVLAAETQLMNLYTQLKIFSP